MAFNESAYDVITYNRQNQKYIWRVTTLWRYGDQIEPELVDINQFDWYLEEDRWFQDYSKPSLKNLIVHFKRILVADLSYPMILSPEGEILDGFHRLARAILNNEKKIKVITLIELPPSDFSSIEELTNSGV